MVSSRPPKSFGLNKCLIGYSLYFVLYAVKIIKMTILWFIYYTIRVIKNKYDEGDGLLIMPCLMLDALITAISLAF